MWVKFEYNVYMYFHNVKVAALGEILSSKHHQWIS